MTNPPANTTLAYVPNTPAVCPRCGKRLEPFTMGDGVPVCGCKAGDDVEAKYIYFNGKYWKVEDLEIEVIEGADDTGEVSELPQAGEVEDSEDGSEEEEVGDWVW